MHGIRLIRALTPGLGPIPGPTLATWLGLPRLGLEETPLRAEKDLDETLERIARAWVRVLERCEEIRAEEDEENSLAGAAERE